MEPAEVIFFITWLGQSGFLIEAKGVKILMDPAGPKLAYSAKPVAADIVTVSHEHFDHNAIEMAEGKPIVLRGLKSGGADWNNVQFQDKGVTIRSVGTFHDEAQGAKRGKNAVFIIEIEGLRVAHTGDLGHVLSAQQVQAIGPVDILFICIGGRFTIGPEEAKTVIGQLKPRLAIPMHYKTEASGDLPLQGPEAFLKGWEHVVRADTERFGIPKGLAGYPEGQTTIVCLPYRGQKAPVK